MDRTAYKSLALILARDLAENLATPLFVADAAGTMVFYNEPAERLLGRRFSETGELPVAEWSTIWTPHDLGGPALTLAETPIGIALMERRPAHRRLVITGLDGVDRVIEVSAFPLFSSATEFSGAIAIFWEEPG
ncbi:MAG: PAS domain-containing protein [Actinomycetota bacterium]